MVPRPVLDSPRYILGIELVLWRHPSGRVPRDFLCMSSISHSLTFCQSIFYRCKEKREVKKDDEVMVPGGSSLRLLLPCPLTSLCVRYE